MHFNHKTSRKTSWHSPDGKVHNQIDFIFLSRRFVTGVNRARTRTFNKPDVGSDLVMMTLKLKLKVNKKSNGKRMHFDLEKLKDPVIAEQYQEELAGRFATLLLTDQDPQSLCDDFTNTMENVAEEKLRKFRKIRKPWITTEVIEKCDNRREKRKKRKLHVGAAEMAEYRIANKKVRKALTKAKNNWIERQVEEIEDNLKRNNSKMAYAVVKKLCSTQIDETKRKSVSLIEDSDGNLLTKEDTISRRWKEYCEELYNYEIRKILQVLDEPVQVEDTRDEKEILLAEVEWTIEELKKGKTPGADKIKAEQIQYGGETTVRVLHKLCNAILKTKE